jgi:3'-phosphoadenosine 5'-phosphosulfate sulfotransferase (PAPS reductase)/FAD synthetase
MLRRDSFRDEFGQWEPQGQRPELWSLYNGRIRRGEHVRVFPISNWTTLEQVVLEIAATQVTERGQTRADDRVTEAAMEDRKRKGYF